MNAARMIVAAGLGIALVASPALAGNAPQKGGQQAVAVDQLPAAVTAAIEKAYPKSTIVSAAKINRGGQTGYELSVKTSPDAQPIAVMASADGMIRTGAKTAASPAGTPAPRKGARKGGAAAPPPAQGETVAVNQLPKAVVQAITEAYPKDVIVDAMRIASGSQLLYQLTLTDVSHVMPMLVLVGVDGKIQKR
jgi:hypothetical protein